MNDALPLGAPVQRRSALRRPLNWIWIAIICASAYGITLFDWHVVWASRWLLLHGIGVSWLLTLIGIGIGLPVGIVLAAGRLYGPPGIRHLAVGVIELVRATPQLMIIFWIYFTYPAISGSASPSAWGAAILALSAIAAAYFAEIMRSGLQSVPDVQMESAHATGLSLLQTFLHVVLPQAIRNMFPAFISMFVMIFKMTSFVYVIGLVDLFRATILINNREYAPYTLYFFMGAVYVVSCFALTSISRRFDRAGATKL
ncbi:amino acid ABC transporter permease [Ancylobacter mangrovi]|uniref:amino acid ABC transporter permease n=1 Tax=Ancylobacter mangrovi TaxID=2972472 RepID=UPI0021617219|nr:amino acid ABC transporter permease [Ancylobacter mangrovi]MCS0503362.1 amino acid ABC transporter permease [Ancylobacter mangrovi]